MKYSPVLFFPAAADPVHRVRSGCLVRSRAVTLLVCLVLMAAMAGGAAAQEAPRIRGGLYLEKNSSLQPGLEVSYTSPTLLKGHPRFSLSYATTRLATALGSNGLAKDKWLFTSGWYFRPRKRIDPYLQLELGYARFDREDEELFALLDNTAAVASVLLGLEAALLQRRLYVYGDLGYSILTSSTVYPFVASAGVSVPLSRRLFR